MWDFGGPTVESERETTQGGQDARALQTVQTMLGHSVGQLRDARDETRVKLVTIVVL